jgi:hypothetical protein
MGKLSLRLTDEVLNRNACFKRYGRIPEAMEIMQCSRTTAQRCFVEINKRLKAQGCFVIAGRCNRREFYKAIGFER